jgi:hypothetical protein
MKFKSLSYLFSLSLVASLISCTHPQSDTPRNTENTSVETIKAEETSTELTEDESEWLFFNYIVSVPDEVEISSAKAFLYKDKLNLTANVTTLIQLKEQMPKDIPLEITYNGPFQFCTFTFDDGSEIIFQFTQSQE